jgi:hypothetical protein
VPFTDRRGVDLETFDDTHLLFHLAPVGVNSTTDIDGMVRRYCGHSRLTSPFINFRQVVIELGEDAPSGRQSLKQALHVRVARTCFIEIEHCRLLGVSAGKLFAGFQQICISAS